jgi:hypothetical protein
MLTPPDRPSRGLVLRSEDAKESTMIYIRNLGAAPDDIEMDLDPPHWSEPIRRVLRRWEGLSAFGQMAASGVAVESAF